MKIYGWGEGLTLRGEMLAAEVSSTDLKAWPLEVLASELGWECAFFTFKDAQSSLITALDSLCADRDIINAVRNTKASFLPVSTL